MMPARPWVRFSSSETVNGLLSLAPIEAYGALGKGNASVHLHGMQLQYSAVTIIINHRVAVYVSRQWLIACLFCVRIRMAELLLPKNNG